MASEREEWRLSGRKLRFLRGAGRILEVAPVVERHSRGSKYDVEKLRADLARVGRDLSRAAKREAG